MNSENRITRSMIARVLVGLFLYAPMAFSQTDVVMNAMRDEMDRSKKELKLGDDEKPYYIEYRVEDSTATVITATLGVLSANHTSHNRQLNVQVRAGEPKLDNTNFLLTRRFSAGVSGFLGSSRAITLDNDYKVLRRDLWLSTDAAYKQSVSDLSAKRSVLESRKSSETIPDFSPAKPITSLKPEASFSFDHAKAEKLARDSSAIFRSYPEITESQTDITVRELYTRYMNSEGTVFTRSEPVIQVFVRAKTNSVSGAPLMDSFSVFSRSVDAIDEARILRDVKELASELAKFRTAESLDRYNGPVLFEGEAAGQLLGEVIAPGIGATRFPLSDEPQFESAINEFFGQMGGAPLSEKLGGRVMPEFLSVTDRPQLEVFNGIKLLGTRDIDDEGVPTREVKVVEGGVLKTLLSTRTPTNDVKESTGSKGLFGAVPSNLFLMSTKTETSAELRQHLLKLAKARNLEYGLVIRHAGLATLSWIGRFGAINGAAGIGSSDLRVYKLFADGHEERVRGVELASLNANVFRDVTAVGDTPVVYNGPHVPMINAIFQGFGAGSLSGDAMAIGSFISPPILFEEVSLKKSNSSSPKGPLMPSPLSIPVR